MQKDVESLLWEICGWQTLMNNCIVLKAPWHENTQISKVRKLCSERTYTVWPLRGRGVRCQLTWPPRPYQPLWRHTKHTDNSLHAYLRSTKTACTQRWRETLSPRAPVHMHRINKQKSGSDAKPSFPPHQKPPISFLCPTSLTLLQFSASP